MKHLLPYGAAILAIVAALVAIKVMVAGPDPALVAKVSGFLALGALATFSLISLANGIALVRRGHFVPRLLGGLSLLSLVVLTAWFQRHTDLGIFLLGGDAAWVESAARSETEESRRAALATALEGTQYALNTVESTILDDFKANPKLQSELFTILSEITPNPSWQERYKARSHEVMGLP